MKNSRFASLFLGPVALAALPGAGAAQEPLELAGASTEPDLSQLSIEELAQIPVRTALKRLRF